MLKRLLVLALGCLSWSAFEVLACSCARPGSVMEEKARSAQVFVGRVVGVEQGEARGYPVRRVTFYVTRTFKGDKGQVLRIDTGMGGGDCGYDFQPGVEYVVYAYGSQGALETGSCTLTGPAVDPRSGLRILRGGT